MNDINELSKISIEEYLNNDEMCIAVTKKKYLEYPEQPIAEFYSKVIDNILEYSGDIDKEFKDRIFEDWFRGIWKGAGSILSAASLVDRNVSVFNCTGVVIQGDTLDDIADARKWVSKMAAHRQGIGILFDKLRPRGMKVNNSALVSEGAVHWMKSFDNIGYEVGQLSRQCALLIALSVDHPDVKEFITCKDDVNNIQNANISVQVTDEFMINVRDNRLHHMSFTTEKGETYTVEIPAIELFKLICNQAWKNGEPGLQFIDRMKSWSIIEALGYSIEITNACSEVPMTDQSVCCLAPLNMEFVPDPFKSSNDFHKFMKDKVNDMVRFMDDVVQYELNLPYKSPTIKQREVVSDLREIGLGILNLHKWFYGIGIAYDSEEAVKYTDEFFKWYLYYAFKASTKLAEERGACGAWTKLKNEGKLEEYETPFLTNFFNEFPEMREVYHQTGIRNGSLVSIAPTGCGVVSNEILTDSGVVSIKDILMMNNINFEEIEKDPFQEGKWFDFINPIKVKVKEGVYQDVNKIYYNGKKFTRTIIFEDGTECTFTGEHPLKVSMDGKEFWIQTKDLKEGMEVIQY